MNGPDSLDYEIVDVFAPRPFAGNPLAVVSGADGLGSEQCQAPADEFSLSETSGETTGRPSVLECTVTAAAGRAAAATVGGTVVPVASGRIRVSS